MGFTLEQIVPWGRSFAEYVAMFALTDDDLQKRILGCGDGPAAFNAELSKRGGRVVSIDPLYAFTADEIRRRIDETSPVILDQARRNKEEFVWTSIRSVEELGQVRMEAMETFLTDYDRGRNEGRYVCGELPRLPFADAAFDLAVCSHLLFLYSGQMSEDLHTQSIRALCRVATEVRVFPLMELGAKPSRHLQPVIDRLTADGHSVCIEKVPYEFQRGGNQMMRVRR